MRSPSLEKSIEIFPDISMGQTGLPRKQNWSIQKAYKEEAENLVEAQPQANPPPNLAIDIKKCSSFIKLINVTKRVFQFIIQKSNALDCLIKQQQHELLLDIHKPLGE